MRKNEACLFIDGTSECKDINDIIRKDINLNILGRASILFYKRVTILHKGKLEKSECEWGSVSECLSSDMTKDEIIRFIKNIRVLRDELCGIGYSQGATK